MDKKEKTEVDRIELRSEKVQEILGAIPNGLVRWGIVVIVLIFVVLVTIALCVEFPYGNGETILQHVFRLSFKE